MARRFVYVAEMGSLYKLSHRNWRNYCKVRSLQDANIETYGTYIGGVTNSTDWQPSDFKLELQLYYSKKGEVT